jgi:hypothetical protein
MSASKAVGVAQPAVREFLRLNDWRALAIERARVIVPLIIGDLA